MKFGRRTPCADCPWRTDVPAGQFPAERYDALRATAPDEDGQPGLFDPMFACHKSPEGAEFACAGWLAVCGAAHVRVRLAVAFGDLPADALSPQPGWPELFPDYATMAAAQGRR